MISAIIHAVSQSWTDHMHEFPLFNWVKVLQTDKEAEGRMVTNWKSSGLYSQGGLPQDTDEPHTYKCIKRGYRVFETISNMAILKLKCSKREKKGDCNDSQLTTVEPAPH